MSDEAFRLDGKTAVVLGASRGIGAASAVACARAGAQVVLLGRSWDDLVMVSEQILQAGGRALIGACDVTSKQSIDQAFASIEHVDVFVNSAGINRPQPFLDVAEETYDGIFAVNVRGAFFAAQAALRKMRAARQGGAIVMMSSQMGHVGAPLRTVYCATKHAIEGLTKSLAVEAAPFGVRVVSIAPTFVRTAMTAMQLDDPEIGPGLLDQIPLGRFGTPEEIATAVVYAASPAAAMMSGSSLRLDGGWTAR
ncbi:MAG: SDR family NAD(P)-dependent oxidoreductase [Solirubrobacteraceae bacterium]